MARVIGQPRIDHPLDGVVVLQPSGQLECVVDMALHPQGQRLQPLQQEEAVERRLRCPQIPEAFDPSPNRKGDIAKRTAHAEHVGEYQTVIAGGRISEERELAVGPVELAGIDDHSADGRSMSADPLGG